MTDKFTPLPDSTPNQNKQEHRSDTYHQRDPVKLLEEERKNSLRPEHVPDRTPEERLLMSLAAAERIAAKEKLAEDLAIKAKLGQPVIPQEKIRRARGKIPRIGTIQTLYLNKLHSSYVKNLAEFGDSEGFGWKVVGYSDKRVKFIHQRTGKAASISKLPNEDLARWHIFTPS